VREVGLILESLLVSTSKHDLKTLSFRKLNSPSSALGGDDLHKVLPGKKNKKILRVLHEKC
jgi:hypothetical protein